MSTSEIAKRLTELCSKEEYETAQKELYADGAVSIENYDSTVFDKETHGLKAIVEKGHKFVAMVEEIHATKISEPLIVANSIAFILTMDVTMKGQKRNTMTELCVYKVKDGKIISEEFFI